jgi:hypothetical protein
LRYALGVWAYAWVAFCVASLVKVQVYRMLEHRHHRQQKHLTRVESRA